MGHQCNLLSLATTVVSAVPFHSLECPDIANWHRCSSPQGYCHRSSFQRNVSSWGATLCQALGTRTSMGSCPQDSGWPQDLLTPKESGLKNCIASSSVIQDLFNGWGSLIPLPTIYLGTKSHEQCYIYGNMRIYFLLILACFTFLTFVVRKNDRSDALFGK